MKKIKSIKINNLFIFVVVFIFLCLIFKLVYVGLGNIKVDGSPLSEFAEARDTVKKTTVASRGTIYSSDNAVLAKDVNSYTVIAYLDPSRTKDEERPYHVVDKKATAKALSPLINMSEKKILSLLNTTIEICDDNDVCKDVVPYQVELGPGGRGITELLKGQIEDLDLPGIDFLSSTKRYYPNGDFLSYTLGYAKNNDNNEYVGEMGIELFYNKELTGENGYIEYQSDLQGYQITSVPNVEKKALPGNDIYLTIDTNIQMFTEQAITTIEEAKPEWATIAVMDAKTGKILSVASTPSFNNNTLEIKSYYDPFASYTYEPGSTMKIFSYMAAHEYGIYDGEKKFKSGRLKVDDAVIKDWNGYGWGNITYNEGFYASSNVAASSLGLELGRAKLKDFYNLLGFGEKTGISLPNESEGIINFKYNTEVAAASYGQGITVTAVQMLQALSVLSNDGTMIKPYLVSKIVDSSTGEIVLENERTELSKVCSEETVESIIDLMRGVVDGRSKMSTGTDYSVKNYDLVGKTGTAEIASSGGYLAGTYVRSFAGIFPGNDPQVIIYAASSKMSNSKYLKTAVRDLVKNVGTYLNIYGDVREEDTDIFTTESYINKDTKLVSENLEKSMMETIIIGDGDKIINQYPSANTKLNVGNKIFLLTNSDKYIMPDIKDWSRSDVSIFANFIGLKTSFEGYGYVKEYSIKKDTEINIKDTLKVVLENKYKKEED